MADEINNIQPGIDIEPEQKKKLAEDNARITAEAHKMAAEQRSRDIAEGNLLPPERTLANIIKRNIEEKGGENALQSDSR